MTHDLSSTTYHVISYKGGGGGVVLRGGPAPCHAPPGSHPAPHPLAGGVEKAVAAGFQTGSGQTGFSQKGHKSHIFVIFRFKCPHVATFCVFLLVFCCVFNILNISLTFSHDSSEWGIAALLRRPRLS